MEGWKEKEVVMALDGTNFDPSSPSHLRSMKVMGEDEPQFSTKSSVALYG